MPYQIESRNEAMTEIGFYHLTRSTAEDALPPLLGRTLSLNKSAVIRCPDSGRAEALSAALWRAAEPVWLPHGTPAAGDADLQPIWITSETDAPNGATFLFLIDGVDGTGLDGFERVFDLFDGNDDEQRAKARQRWSAAKARGLSLAYWRQEQKGWTKAG